MATYDYDYFINKFEGIPEENWATARYVKRDNPKCCCVLGHCGMRSDGEQPAEVTELLKLSATNALWFWWALNDGYLDKIDNFTSYGSTPKERVLNMLRELKGQP